MYLVSTRLYLLLHIVIGLFIIGFELLHRWIIETYQIRIHTCPDVFYVELKQLNKAQYSNWFENRVTNLVELFNSIHCRCTSKELQLNFRFIFVYFRYFWLSVTSVYSYRILRMFLRDKTVK